MSGLEGESVWVCSWGSSGMGLPRVRQGYSAEGPKLPQESGNMCRCLSVPTRWSCRGRICQGGYCARIGSRQCDRAAGMRGSVFDSEGCRIVYRGIRGAGMS